MQFLFSLLDWRGTSRRDQNGTVRLHEPLQAPKVLKSLSSPNTASKDTRKLTDESKVLVGMVQGNPRLLSTCGPYNKRLISCLQAALKGLTYLVMYLGIAYRKV
jgi:hypothetical protein